MPPTFFFDLNTVDTGQVLYDTASIEAVNPQRGDMRHIDEVIWENEDRTAITAVKHVRAEEFWVPGHLPDRPLLPGVIMIEAAAQCASFVVLRRLRGAFMGFVGVDDVKFRGQVKPGDRLLLMCKQVEMRSRRQVCLTQGVVDGSLVFQGKITGMLM